ncbi:MAG: trypsin-like peptidase domain-containing protein [Candidatus Obscuribacterales bacterium]|nr:trypsin-like peptidase domain-containing protein [Candidatus Obscuribacterales bacterium]
MAPLNPLIPNSSELESTLKLEQNDIRTQAATRLLEDVRGSVVKVMAGTDTKFCCDGFFINDGTEIVTSNNLFQSEDAIKNIQIVTNTGETIAAEIEKRQDGHDEVVLKLPGVKPGSHKGLKLGSSDELVERESVYVYGHKEWNAPPVLAAGRVQSHYFVEGEDVPRQQFIDCVMPPEVGMSGSPLINEDGEVVGMYRTQRETKPSASQNVLVKFDDVYEIQSVLDGKRETASADAAETVEKPTEAQLKAITDKVGKLTKPTVIEIGADWCPACQKMQSTLDKTEKKYGESLQVVRVNFDKDKDFARAFNVRALPTVIYIGVGPDGEILSQEDSVGFSESAFQQHIDKLLKDKKPETSP